MACGGGDTSTSVATDSPSATNKPVEAQAEKTTTNQETQTESTKEVKETPKETSTATPTPAPKAEEPAPKAEEPAPKAEEPAPEPEEPELYDGFFILKKDTLQGVASNDIETFGWLKNEAENDSGLVLFDYNGVSVSLYWTPWTASVDELLNSSYSLLTNSQPSVEFSAINDGPITVNSDSDGSELEGKYASYSVKTAEGTLSGGLMGVWVCKPSAPSGSIDRGFTLRASGADATTTQLRFNRLLGAFQCGE